MGNSLYWQQCYYYMSAPKCLQSVAHQVRNSFFYYTLFWPNRFLLLVNPVILQKPLLQKEQ